ncbi:MAG: hypothetical protein K2G96_00735, partial [Clostridia bacterium]|nr:hypothetical protein [Clostridia bacterium]
MKNKKKTILISLLSAACLTAGAFGIAACKKDNNPDSPPTLQDSYFAYVQNVGDGALNYEDWLEIIVKDVVPNVSAKTIASAKISGGEIIITYTDDTVKTVGTVTGALDIDVLGNTVTVNATSASAAKSAASSAVVSEEIKSEYDKYAENVGEDALSYESWYELISKDFVLNTDDLKAVKSAQINSKSQFILKYEDNSTFIAGLVGGNFIFDDNGTEKTVEVSVFTVTAVDQNGDPVKNAWIKLSYYDYANAETITIESSQTNEDGKAYFAYVPQTNIKYSASLADVETNVPAGYKLDLGTIYGMAKTSVEFDANRQATMTFKYAPNDFLSAKKTEINYKRVYNSFTGRAEETNEATEKILQANRYSYFVFAPYTADSQNENRALSAATGKYRISVSTDPSANVVMYSYAGTVSYMSCDSETGIPTAITAVTGNAPQDAEDASVYTGTNYIDLNLYSAVVRGGNVFGVTVDKTCTVTITVERIGDAAEPPVAETETVKVTGSPIKCAEQSGTLTEVATDGSVNVVLGNDGYYHIGSKTGPILYVNLNKALRRVAEVAIKDLPTQKLDSGEVIGERVFIFTAEYDENGFATLIKDYNNVIKTYSALCNSDGVYGVNQDLYDFLHLYGHN